MDNVECEAGEHDGHVYEVVPEWVIGQTAAMLSAMGDEERLRLLERLLTGRHCVSELAEETGAGLSTVSQRLLKLRQGGLVRRVREGRHIYYELHGERVAALVQHILNFAAESRSR